MVEHQKNHMLTQRIQQLENEFVMVQTITEEKENIWVEIYEAMIEIWLFVEKNFEQQELVQRLKEFIEEIQGNFSQKPGEFVAFIVILNSTKKEELEEYEITDQQN